MTTPADRYRYGAWHDGPDPLAPPPDLRAALEAERNTLARDPSEDARFRELQLDALPSDTAGSVRELSEYDWRSSDAREDYEEIRQLLGREVMEQRFQGMREALQDVTPEQV